MLPELSISNTLTGDLKDQIPLILNIWLLNNIYHVNTEYLAAKL